MAGGGRCPEPRLSTLARYEAAARAQQQAVQAHVLAIAVPAHGLELVGTTEGGKGVKILLFHVG